MENQFTKPKIAVLGCGSMGINALNFMMGSQLEGVEFMSVDNDEEVLSSSYAPMKFAYEPLKISDVLKGTHLLFVVAGFGEAFGETHAHLIAKLAKEQNILTVGLVIKPDKALERHRAPILELSIKRLLREVDSLLTFEIESNPNEHIMAGVTCITHHLLPQQIIGIDFADIRTVIHNGGRAMLGISEATGEGRANKAAKMALKHIAIDPLRLKTTTGLLISITGGDDMTLGEIDEATTQISQEFSEAVNSVLGAIYVPSLEGKMRVSLITTHNERHAF